MRAVLFHTPLLRAINLSIAVLLVAVLAMAVLVRLAKPARDLGHDHRADRRPATIARDARGVPHITAASWEDAIFLQGYVTAQDRMWQMDALRRLAAGELAEVVGKTALESDQDAHRWRMQRIAENQERHLTPDSRAILAAYARGVNYFIWKPIAAVCRRNSRCCATIPAPGACAILCWWSCRCIACSPPPGARR